MAMDNEQISTKLAVVESQINVLVQSSQRVETLLERISLFDKTQAELLQRHAYLNERYIEVAKEVEKCSQSHTTETTRLWKEISELNKTSNRAQGFGIAANIFLVFVVGIGGYFFNFLFETAQQNRASLIKQSQQIIQLEKETEK